MRRRLVLSTALIALTAVVVLGVPLGAVEAARVRQDTATRLEREADRVAGVADDPIERRARISPATLRRVTEPHHRIVLRTPTQQVASGPPLVGAVLTARAGSTVGVSVVAQAPAGELDRRIRRAWLLIAALGAGGVAIAVGLAALQARRLARPLEAIARRSVQLGDGDFSVRAGHFGVPEIDAIAQGLDSSAARIAALVAGEREFSANVSHQLRTPLTALRLRLERLQLDGHGDAARARELEAAVAEADRLEATIADLLALARRTTSSHPVDVQLAAIVHEHAAAWRPVFERAGRRLEAHVARNVHARASRGTAGQVLSVLIDNAFRHGTGTVRVEVTAGGAVAVVAVSDEGAGVPEAARDRVFERGASGAGGTGIGLHIARALAEADGGELTIADRAPARFELRLPVSDDRAAPRA